MKPRYFVSFLIGTLLAGCVETATLYPLNPTGPHDTVLKMHYTEYGAGHGSVTVRLPDGKTLKGEYSVVYGGAVGFGTILASVYGQPGYANGTTTSTSVFGARVGEGMASLYGDGISMECEFVNDGFTGNGYGACRTSRGALYRVQY